MERQLYVESLWADRLRLLGNGVVPAQAAEAFTFLADALWGAGLSEAA